MDMSEQGFFDVTAERRPGSLRSVRGPQARQRGAASDAAISRVLVVQNAGPESCARLVQILRRAGFIAKSCHSAELIALIAKGMWDVVLVDADASSEAAVLLTREVRVWHSPSELPVLILGGQVGPSTRGTSGSGAALAAGANDWVAKPGEPAELIQRLLNLTELSRLRRSYRIQDEVNHQALLSRTASLDALVETGLMMSMERDRSKLLRHLLDEARRLLHCDGATMYLVTEEKTLRFELRTRDDPLPSTQIPLYDEAGRPNENYVSVHVAVHNRSVLIDDVYHESRFDLSGTRAFDAASGYRTVSMLCVPIAPRGGEPIGVLQFMNAVDRESGYPVPFARDMVGPVEALAAQAAVALDNLNLVQSQRELMESLIRVLATAIDAKSPYTGRHCERVPELAFLLAEAACQCNEGPLATFGFRNEDEWQEFRIGAWLHDCGKVTTPEYVIDKATKLETIYNRIHEIRTRFEVLLRDVEIDRLQSTIEGNLTPAREASLQARTAQLVADFAFVAQCNIGTEEMSDADIERLAGIAKHRWTRHLDDRLGLSPAELDRHASEPRAVLPTSEPLLADRARDLVQRSAEHQLEPEFGFKMAVPEHLYNHGEFYNLSVRRGTLNAEERFKINEHMVHTIMMLERMPFPKHLQRVPEYAGTHHERIDGKGYPRQLSSAELSVPSRIMAVADIFEALTASDRPYKKPKKLSEALTVLQRMAGEHIDADIYNLFIRSGVFLVYAKKHLADALIDVTDGEPYLAKAAHEQVR